MFAFAVPCTFGFVVGLQFFQQIFRRLRLAFFVLPSGQFEVLPDSVIFKIEKVYRRL